MDKNSLNATNKKAGKGNGNSVINNYERQKNSATDYISGDSSPSSSGHKFGERNFK